MQRREKREGRMIARPDGSGAGRRRRDKNCGQRIRWRTPGSLLSPPPPPPPLLPLPLLLLLLTALVAATPNKIEGSKDGGQRSAGQRARFHDDSLEDSPQAAPPAVPANSSADLIRAIAAGQKREVKRLIENARADLEQRCAQGATPLWVAAFLNKPGIVRLLIEAGANLELRNINGETPLWAACQAGNHEIAVLLIAAGADIEAEDTLGATPLIVASQYGHENIVANLIHAGAEIEAKRNKSGQTALWAASFSGHANVVGILLQNGASVDSVDADDATPLFAAAQQGHSVVVSKLVKFRAFLDQRRKDGATALHAAAAFCHKSIVKLLLKKKADPRWRDNEGRTAADIVGAGRCPSLHEQYNIETLLTPIFNAARKDQAHTVATLLDSGAVDVEIRLKSNNMTVLHVASAFASECAILALIQRGADPRALDIHDSTPINIIGSSRKIDNRKRIKLLQMLQNTEENQTIFLNDLQHCDLLESAPDQEDSPCSVSMSLPQHPPEQSGTRTESALILIVIAGSSTILIIYLLAFD